MTRAKKLWIGVALGMLAVIGSACGVANSDNRSADGTSAEPPQQEQSFFERLALAEVEPVVVPAGTTLVLELQQTLSSHETPAGAAFDARVAQEVSVAGRVAIPAGTKVRGRVTEAHPAKKVGGRAILSLSFDEIETPEGDSVAISARLAQSGKSEVAKDAAIIGGSTLGGAILGEAVDEGEGTVVGAVVGGIAGTIGALKTKGKPVVLPAGSTLPIVLEQPVTVTR